MHCQKKRAIDITNLTLTLVPYLISQRVMIELSENGLVTALETLCSGGSEMHALYELS